jgi:hypothetical protein
MEKDTLFLEQRILHFPLAVKHPKRQESDYKLLSRLLNRRHL